ncbi:hypothetical protein [Turicibacter sanguinis]|uniref:hypothetical protein n=1 Tax=Turicibacter sanguinis TaxID=154288 RepID=UPI0018A0C956|nr:hypothetical protein [Turicibacter sanguinis]
MERVRKYDRKELKKLKIQRLEISNDVNLDELLNDVSNWLINNLMNDGLTQQKNKFKNTTTVSCLV